MISAPFTPPRPPPDRGPSSGHRHPPPPLIQVCVLCKALHDARQYGSLMSPSRGSWHAWQELLQDTTGLLDQRAVVRGRSRAGGARQVHAAALRRSPRGPAGGRGPGRGGGGRGGRQPLPPARRHDILSEAARLLTARRDRIRALYVAETGFTPADADTEIARAAATMRLSAEEAVRIAGEEIPVAATPGQRGPAGVHHPRAGRRGRGDHAVQRPAEHGGAQDRPGPRGRQRGRAQAR